MRLIFEASFARDLERLQDKKMRQRVQRILAEIKVAHSWGAIKNLERLRGTEAFYRIRVGDYRIGLELREDTAILVRILHRKDIYRYFP